MARRPWFKFWPTDWAGDRRLHGCSLAARGLWIELCCLMHEAEPYGHLTRPAASVVRLVGASEQEIAEALLELEQAGVLSRTPKGIVYSRRMVQDEARRLAGRENKLNGLRGHKKAAPLKPPLPSSFNPREPLASDSSSASVPVPTYASSRRTPSLRSGAAPRLPGMENPHQTAVDGWAALWRAHRGEDFGWDGKHLASIKLALAKAKGSAEVLLERAKRLIEDPPDAWYAQNASPSLLNARWNELAARVIDDPTVRRARAREQRATERMAKAKAHDEAKDRAALPDPAGRARELGTGR